jgi:hypothetical protein
VLDEWLVWQCEGESVWVELGDVELGACLRRMELPSRGRCGWEEEGGWEGSVGLLRLCFGSLRFEVSMFQTRSSIT